MNGQSKAGREVTETINADTSVGNGVLEDSVEMNGQNKAVREVTAGMRIRFWQNFGSRALYPER